MIIIAKAFILITTGKEDENEVFKNLNNVSDIKEAYHLNGAYDIIALLESENMEKLKNTISREIRQIPQVRSMVSLLVTNLEKLG